MLTCWSAFGTVDHEIHRKRRAANSPFFSKQAIKGAEPLIQEQVKTLCDVLHISHVNGDVVELRVTLVAFSTDTVSSYVRGQSKGLQDDKLRAKEWSETILAVPRLTPIAKQCLWMVPLSDKLPASTLEKLSFAVGRMTRFRQVGLLQYYGYSFKTIATKTFNYHVLAHTRKSIQIFS